MLLVYVTCKNGAEAEKIAKAVVKEKLAACGNYFGSVSFHYWKKKPVRKKETVLLLKTTNSNFERLKRRVRELHSYEVPCILALESHLVNEEYAKWVSANCL